MCNGAGSTLGYDPAKKKYVGTFIASVMTHLWIYSGSLDAAHPSSHAPMAARSANGSYM